MAAHTPASTDSGNRRRQPSSSAAAGTTMPLTSRGPRHWSSHWNCPVSTVSAKPKTASSAASARSPAGAPSTWTPRILAAQLITHLR